MNLETEEVGTRIERGEVVIRIVRKREVVRDNTKTR